MDKKKIFLNVAAVAVLALAMEFLIPKTYLSDLVWAGLILVPLAGGLCFQDRFYPKVAYTPPERRLLLRIGGSLLVFSLLWLMASLAIWRHGLPMGAAGNVIFSVFFLPLIIGLLLLFTAFTSRPRD